MRVNLTIPVFNERERLPQSMERIGPWLSSHPQWAWELVMADNGSTDGTTEWARELERDGNGARLVRLEETGRGRVLKKVWLESKAEVVSYMDVDLSTDLEALPHLISAVASGEYDLAVGSRLLQPDWTTRCWTRERISRGYNWLVRAVFGTRFSDTQCGFKAMSREAAQALLPLVEDGGWFFDTELLVLAETLGYRIYDLAARWVEDGDSRVKIWRTALADLRGIIRLRRRLGQLKATVGHREGLEQTKEGTA